MSHFPKSPWTMLASLSSDSPDRSEVLDSLFRLYAKPIYAFVAREYPQADPGDVTQEVFMRLMRTNELHKADRERGKLRTYLITIVRSVAWKDWKSEQPHRATIPLDSEEFARFAESIVKPDGIDATDWLDLLCARDAIGRSFRMVRKDYVERGKEEAYEVLRKLCVGETVPDAGALLGLSDGALRVQVHRFRTALRRAFHSEVAALVENSGDVEQEVRHLLGLLAGPTRHA